MSGVSQKVFADVVGITPREVRNLHDRGLPFTLEKGRRVYNLAVAVPWYVKFKAGTEKREDPQVVASKELQRRRLEAEVRTAELTLAEREASLVSVDYLEAQMTRAFDTVRARIMNLPGRVGPVLVGCKTIPEVVSRIKPIVDELLLDLSELGAAEDLDVDDEDDAESGTG